MSFLVTLATICAVLFIGLVSVMLRRVVSPNEVHIVQSRKATTSYGKDTDHGNVYYEIPAWVPVFGVTKIVLPVSVFDVRLQAYEAYDQGRVPFVVDIIAFFRIENTNLAAQRVQHFKELEEQLIAIVQGAIRTVLASHDIDAIMIERSKFGQQFTAEVTEQLQNWGVIPVKNIELMDIRDSENGKAIHNIMAKKQSLIEMQSRTEVAKNQKDANIAEINAQQETETQKQSALELIGLRTAQKDKQVGIANQMASQEVKEQERATKEKEMAVIQVGQVRQAEITKNVRVVEAEQAKQTSVIQAEGQKLTTVTIAEGNLQSKQLEAKGIQAQGEAVGAADTAKNLATVAPQITLAKEIGGNEGYQKYLVTIRRVEQEQAVGVAQAAALEKANIKIISNSGDPVAGITSVRDLFSSKGGTSIGAMLEGLAQTEQGQNVLSAIKGKGLNGRESNTN